MPIVTIRLLKPMSTIEKKRVLAKEVTNLMERVAKVPRDAVRVIFHEDEPENVSIGDQLICDREEFKKRK